MKRAILLGTMLVGAAAFGSEVKGTVTLGGLPVPGATVTAVRGTEKVQVVTGLGGGYTFADLQDGAWTLSVDMLCFEPMTRAVEVKAGMAAEGWELKMQPVNEILAHARTAKVEAAPTVALVQRPVGPEVTKASPVESKAPDSDGFLINGSSSNAATSQYSMAQAFGNTRSSKNLYSYGLGVIYDTSALDAAPYSLTGLNTGKPGYNRVTLVANFGGPLNLGKLMRRGPNLFVGYRGTRNTEDDALVGLVPTDAQRATVTDAAAANLLGYYPHADPTLVGNTIYNYQLSARNTLDRDAFQVRADKSIKQKDQVYGSLEFSSTRLNDENLFKFHDSTGVLGLDVPVNWQHRFNQRIFQKVGYEFSRLRTVINPNFAGVTNVSGNAGITGNDQERSQWGPPTLVFSDGIYSLNDGVSTFNRNRTDATSYSISFNRPHHNVTVGGDLKREQFNVNTQADPRGTLTFTGAATGDALQDFLSGKPDTSSIAFGNADKYLRQTVYDLYVTDDWRVQPTFTVNFGMRYEYGAPVTELKGRLVNVDIASNFGVVAPVSPFLGSLRGTASGQSYPTSLVRPDRLGFEPRVGLSWRPIPGSTLVIRAGYGVYDDTSVYEATALAMAQQAPLSKSLDVANGPGCALNLSTNAFPQCATTTADTFAVDPGFRVGYAQTWQLSAQRDLPGSLVGTVSYLGIKGTRGVQEYLPNTYPIGGAAICATAALCPSGYVYRTSGGDSTREAGTLQLRRRLKSGFTASGQYTFSKAIDDDAVIGGQGGVAVGQAATSATSGTATVAQDWRNLRGERGLSNFDQRHLFTGSIQYTSGQGLGGGSLMQGKAGKLLKEWTVSGTITAGSGLPETPIYLAATPGTGVTGALRASRTGAGIYQTTGSGASGRHLNPAAYAAPALGQYGNAGRNSIYGPGQYSLNSSVARTFRLKDKLNLDARVDATNVLNHITFTSFNAITGGPSGVSGGYLPNPVFGLPVAANATRSLQITLRLRY